MLFTLAHLSAAAVVALVTANTAYATITGMNSCNQYMCVNGLHDSDANVDTYTLRPVKDTPLSSFPWIAIGFGTQMANTPMVITWPNSDGSFTLSQRMAPAEVMPTVQSNPPRTATLSTNSSLSFSNSSATAITFTIPSNSDSTTGKTNLIWAWGSVNPKSSSVSATLVQHQVSGTMNINLVQSLSGSSGTNGGSSTSSPASSPTSGSSSSSSGDDDDDDSESNTNNVLHAHAAVGALATLLFLPLGAMIPRYVRGFSRSRWWFPAHGIIQGIFALAFVVAAAGIAFMNFDGGITSTHRKLGLTLLILVIVQILLGLFTHYYRGRASAPKTGRGPSNYLHMLLGISILAIGWATVWYAIDQEWTLRGHGEVPSGWKVGWGIVVGLWALAYIVGLVFLLPRQMKMEEQARIDREATKPYGSGDNVPLNNMRRRFPNDTEGLPPPPQGPR